MVLFQALDRIGVRGQRVRARAVGANIGRRGTAVEPPLRKGIVPNLNFVFGDWRSPVVNGEEPIQSHRISHLLQNTHAQGLSRGL